MAATLRSTFIFDAGPLGHFARSGHLHVLHEICRDAHLVVTEVVMQEIERGVPVYPELQRVLDAEWLTRVVLQTLPEVGAFAEYAQTLGSSRDRDLGEVATLAWADVHGATAIIDDFAARNAAQKRSVSTHGTLWLVVQAMKERSLSERQGSDLVQALLDTGTRFPFKGASEFIPWAREEGLLS